MMEPSPGQNRSAAPHGPICAACPGCGQGYRIPARLIGRRLRCRHCRTEWRATEIAPKEFRSGRLIGTGASTDSGTVVLPEDLRGGEGSGSIVIDTRWAGRRLGRYEVQSLLGHGGMGAVWRAHDGGLRRDAALKILNERARKEDDSGGLNVALFMQEARAIAKLQHPGVVSIFEVGEDEGQVFLALELMGGGTLKEYVERYGRIPPRELCMMLVGPVRALALAHRRGIIHRDIKPGNLMCDDHGHWKLTDFGLADVAQEAASQRIRGKAVGSLGWIAPETARGDGTTEASDIFSMGLVMLYALTGRPWLQALSRAELMELHKNPPKPDLSGIKGLTPRSAAMVRRCLAVEQSERFVSAGRLAEELRECADEDPEALSRRRKRHASVAVVWAVFGGVVVGAAMMHYFIDLLNREREMGEPLVRMRRPVARRTDARDAARAGGAPAENSEMPDLEMEQLLASAGAEQPRLPAEDLQKPWPEVLGGLPPKLVGASTDGVFHLGTSRCGRRISAAELVPFESIEEALRSGRKPCPECLPAGGEIDVAVVPEDD